MLIAWQRHHGLPAPDRAAAQALVSRAMPDAIVMHTEPLSGGTRTSTIRVEFADRFDHVVLRVYRADGDACGREIGVLEALPAVVLRPKCLYAEPNADPPWALFGWLDASPLRAALRIVSPAQACMLSSDCGAALSAVHTVRFPRSGSLRPDLSLGASLGTWSEALGTLLAGPAGVRLGAVAAELRAFVDRHGAVMDRLFEAPSLCHGDFTPWHVLARTPPRRRGAVAGTEVVGRLEGPDRPRLAGIVDWETAFAGPPLLDVGAFLRHDARLAPGFADAFAHGYLRWGGQLPQNWRELARRLDLIAICRLIERGDARTLARLAPLVEATVSTG